MARKLNYNELRAERDHLSTRAHVLEIALNEMPDATFRFRDGRDTYTWTAYRLAGHAGGYIIGVFDGFRNDKKSTIHVGLLDMAISQQQFHATTGNGMAEAVSRFQSARYNLTRQTA